MSFIAWLAVAVVVLVGMVGVMAVALAGALERQDELQRQQQMLRRLRGWDTDR